MNGDFEMRWLDDVRDESLCWYAGAPAGVAPWQCERAAFVGGMMLGWGLGRVFARYSQPCTVIVEGFLYRKESPIKPYIVSVIRKDVSFFYQNVFGEEYEISAQEAALIIRNKAAKLALADISKKQ